MAKTRKPLPRDLDDLNQPGIIAEKFVTLDKPTGGVHVVAMCTKCLRETRHVLDSETLPLALRRKCERCSI